MTYKITINREECIGCSGCTTCDNFKLDNENKAIVKKAEVDNIGCNKNAEDVCPVDAITITEV